MSCNKPHNNQLAADPEQPHSIFVVQSGVGLRCRGVGGQRCSGQLETGRYEVEERS